MFVINVLINLRRLKMTDKKDTKILDNLRKTRELVDQLLYELDDEHGDKENALNHIHNLAWDLVNATRSEERG